MDFIDQKHLFDTLRDYDKNNLVRFLLSAFDERTGQVWTSMKDYMIGTVLHPGGAYTCFPYIDQSGRFCKGKLIRYEVETGKRMKGKFDCSSLVRILKLKETFNYKQTFFGEHLLPRSPGKAVAVVESEKTALIASICCEHFGERFVWIASGSKQSLKAEKLRRLGADRTYVLYPDADGYEAWSEVAKQGLLLGLDVRVSSLIESKGGVGQKAAGCDLADFLVATQKENAAAKSDAASDLHCVSPDEYDLEERLAIMIYDGGLTEEQAISLIRQERGSAVIAAVV